MISAGIDCGAKNTKTIIMKDGQIIGKGMVLTGFGQNKAIVSMIRRIGVNEDVAMIGGVGRNPALINSMQRELRVKNLYIPDEPEFGAAVGAAVMAKEEA